MQSVSSLYRELFADAAHTVEWRVSVGGTVYGQDKLIFDAGGGDSRPKLGRQLLSGSEPTVGECIAATFSCTIFEASDAVPRMAAVCPEYRLVLGDQASEWITLGTFYIDTRTVDKVTGALSLGCFDRMLIADGVGGKSYADVTGFSTWPQPMNAVAAEIASIMGITIDSGTVIRSGAGYRVAYPNDLTMREVLGYIAAAHGGNWTITPGNALRLVPLTGGTDTLELGAAAAGLKTAPSLAAWSGVTVYWADEEAFEAGDDTGRRLICDCPWATQETANGILEAIRGSRYQPYSADGAIIDMALELGDIVTVGLPGETVSGPVFTVYITGGALEQADIAAPGEDEIDHEYPYSSYVDRSLKRKVTLGASYYGTSISREKGIEIARSDGLSEAIFNSDLFTMRALIDGVMKDRIYFDPIKGDYIFDGALGADAVFTDMLYAKTGDIADLTVDRLSTSRRIRKYILGDETDDNFVRIQDQYIQFVTGTLVPDIVLLTEAGDPLLTEDGDPLMLENGVAPPPIQARNRYNQPLYWQREPVGHTSEGYPTDADGVQIYAGTEETPWPVLEYAYTELVKAQFAFEEYTTSQGDQTYAPVIILGAGDENGNSKGFFLREQNSMILRYVTAQGEETDIRFTDFVDAKHRRLASCDINSVSGKVLYTVEGDESEYALDFEIIEPEQEGDPEKVIFTWPDGHTCEVSVV